MGEDEKSGRWRKFEEEPRGSRREQVKKRDDHQMDVPLAGLKKRRGDGGTQRTMQSGQPPKRYQEEKSKGRGRERQGNDDDPRCLIKRNRERGSGGEAPRGVCPKWGEQASLCCGATARLRLLQSMCCNAAVLHAVFAVEMSGGLEWADCFWPRFVPRDHSTIVGRKTLDVLAVLADVDCLDAQCPPSPRLHLPNASLAPSLLPTEHPERGEAGTTGTIGTSENKEAAIRIRTGLMVHRLAASGPINPIRTSRDRRHQATTGDASIKPTRRRARAVQSFASQARDLVVCRQDATAAIRLVRRRRGSSCTSPTSLSTIETWP